MTETPYAINLKNVTVTRGDLVMIENISLKVEIGQFAAVIGPNGAGKTTLLKVILGILKADCGTVEVLGRSINNMGDKRHKIGYVPQILSVDLSFPVSVFEAVLMGTYGSLGLFKRPGKVQRQRAAAAIDKVGISDLRNRPIGRLSGGQRQRMLIARALANDPELLILDEPTTGVDAAATGSLYTLLRQLKSEGVTIVFVSHDIGVVATYMDTLSCLNRTMVAHGKPEDVIMGDTLSDMYGCDAAYLHHGAKPHIVVEDHKDA